MFELKKLIASVLMPFPLFMIAILIALWIWHRGNPRSAKRLIVGSSAWIVLLSYPPFAALLLKPLESTHPKIDPDHHQSRYIHVLGSGHVSNPDLPLSSELGLVSLARVNEGVSLYRSRPGMKLIFSGYGGDDPISNARKNARMAIALGVDPEDIIILETPKDTHDEAIEAKKIVGNEPLILVTSASHMVRASLLFRKNGIAVVEAPTDFQVKKRDDLFQFPSSVGLIRSEAAFHEYLGLLWGKIRGLL
jgi:uncharacterized SAM-binding protein YcdF (DUF218 family)